MLDFKQSDLRSWIQRVARSLGLQCASNGYSGLPAAEFFDRVYQEGMWGRDCSGLGTSGSGSHDERILCEYLQVAATALERLDNPVVVDLGCGDFNVGRRLLRHAQQYIACDISEVILERNRWNHYASNLEFRHLDIAQDELPRGDIAFVRQVLQHLTNSQIERFVEQLNRQRPYKALVVTEHLPLDPDFTPNLDKPQGPGTRVPMVSGVDITRAPFNLSFRKSRELLSISTPDDDIDARLVTTVYDL